MGMFEAAWHLRFLEREAATQNLRWMAFQALQEAILDELLESRLQATAVAPPSYAAATFGGFRQRSAQRPTATTATTPSNPTFMGDSSTNVFTRPPSLGTGTGTGAGRRARATTRPSAAVPEKAGLRKVKIGFMYLARGRPTHTRKLLQYYCSEHELTSKRDVWLIDHMTAFYTEYVASRRFFPVRRLALAKFVRVSCHP